jgi:hypothetical protein
MDLDEVNTANRAAININAENLLASETEPQEYRIDVDDPGSFSTRRLVRIRHNYHQHPLLQLSRLGVLAKSLIATKQCRFIKPGITASSSFQHEDASPDGRTIDEVFRRIEEKDSWVALYNIQTDPVYKRFLWDVMKSAGHLVDHQEKVFDVRGFVFISAPPSVTPFHIDRENNFWMNIRGRKTISLWDHEDRDVVRARDVENFIVSRSLGEVKLKDNMLAKSHNFDCGPGDGVYFPSTTPHMTRSDTSWVRPGDGVAVSIGIDFYTDRTRRDAHVYTVNRILRKLGLNPRAPHESEWIDRLKYTIGQPFVAMQRLRGYKPPPGFSFKDI